MNELEINKLLVKQVEDIYGRDFDLRSLDSKTRELLSRMNTSYNNLEYQAKQNNILFEEEENIVFTIGMKAGVLRANKKFYATFGFKDLADFKKEYNCICELFIEDPGYLKETTVDRHWTVPIIKNPEKRHKALIKDFNGDKKVYAVLLKEVILDGSKLKICTFTDITELEEAIKSSTKSEEIKTIFMANMSHEIRTPMNGIVGFTSLLLETELSEQQRQFLELIDESTTILNGIINDVLDFSKIENGSLELDFKNVNVFIDFYSVISLFKEEALEKNISYRVDIDPDISESLLMDKVRIVKVLNNLISNAIKFTSEDGEIFIDIQLLTSTDDKELISFSVTDTGIGIDKNDLKTIFKSFRQGDSSFNKQFGGTGLGLSISKSLCELMHGDLQVKSTLGKGSTFSFELSFKKASYTNERTTLRGQQVLYVVENNSRDCQDVLYQLEHFGINFIKITKDDIPVLNIESHIVIVFNYDEFISLGLMNSAVVLIDSRRDAFVVSDKFENVYHISSFVEFPSELYSAILKFNNILKLDRKGKQLDLNILVAEDSRLNRILLDEMLQDYGVKADFVEDGEKAIQMALKNSYDLILMDINMPNVNGVEATKILKEKGVKIPVIAVTANTLQGDRERFLDLGLDDYLSKPISVDSLYGMLLKYN